MLQISRMHQLKTNVLDVKLTNYLSFLTFSFCHFWASTWIKVEEVLNREWWEWTLAWNHSQTSLLHQKVCTQVEILKLYYCLQAEECHCPMNSASVSSNPLASFLHIHLGFRRYRLSWNIKETRVSKMQTRHAYNKHFEQLSRSTMKLLNIMALSKGSIECLFVVMLTRNYIYLLPTFLLAGVSC